MALLTKELQEQVVKLLVSEGLVSATQVKAAQEEVLKTRQPILALLTAKHITDDETVSHAMAEILRVPYVNLNNTRMADSARGGRTYNGGAARGKERRDLCGNARCTKCASNRLSFNAGAKTSTNGDGE